MATEVKLIATGAVSASDLTLTTASAGTNDTSPATTAFVQQEITGLIDSAPDAMNTLNELAAALGDDANFSTTVTNSIATKLPLAGGTMTGALTINNNLTVDTSTFHVDSTNNRVGIGEASPTRTLSVKEDTGRTSGFTDIAEFLDSTLGAGGSVSLNIGKAASNKNLGKMAFKYAGNASNSNSLNFGFFDNDNLMTLTADGKLLVGTNSVGGVGVGGLKLYSNIEETLAIDGSAGTQAIHFHDNGTRRGIIGFSNGTSISSDLSDHDFVIRSETNLGFCTNTSSVQMYIDTSGKVGLGTQAPTHHLEALGTDSALIVHYSSHSRGGIAALSNQRVVLTTTTSGDDIAFGYAGTTISSANFVSRMFIDNSTGNVGIGTTSPGQKLEIGENNSSSNVGYIRLRGHNTLEGNIYKDSTYGLHFDTSSNNQPIRIDGSKQILGITGNVGIGTESPSYKLDVRGQNSATNGHMVYMENNAGGGNGCTFSVQHADGNHSWGIVQELRIQSGSGTDNPSLLFSSGTESTNTWTVGYGYTDVNFRIKRDHGYHNGNWGTSVFTMDRSGNVTISGSLTQNSDERLKENIVTIPDALDKVSQLRGVTFDWKEKDDEGNVRNSMGLIAQEVEAVEGLEVLVTEVAKDGSPEMEEFQPKGVAYENMVGLLIEAIKELKTENNDLKSRIETLEG